MKVFKGLLFTVCVGVCVLTAACGKKADAIVLIETTSSQESAWAEVTTTETQERETASEKESTTETETTTQEVTTEAETTTQESTTETESTTQETTTKAESATQESTTQETTTEAETTTQEPTTQAPALSQEEREALLRQAVQQALPGIVCWGDSMTYGYGGNGESYPSTLQRLINENLIDGIPVVNNGVCVEPSHTIMARAGVWEMYARDFVIPADCTPVEIKILMQDGMYTNLASFGDGGLNPVTIAGVKGTLKSAYHEDEYGWFDFTRLEPGDAVGVPDMTPVIPASSNLYGGYINIIFMGENGYFTSPEHLISQYQLFIDKRGLSRYVIIGLTSGNNTSRGELSQKMADYFGDHYIDMRTELISRGPELVGLERKEGDWYNIQEGILMGYLMSDVVHLNEYGYRAMGMIVYERMDKLGYFDGVKNAIATYR